MFKRVLIANRGEIALRVQRTCREMGISPIAVYSEADETAQHVRMADSAVAIGAAPASESYLDSEKVLNAARLTQAEAIHPGYGFLSENAEFADACEDAGIVFIGPPAAAIRAMGDKMGARARMQAAGVPVVPGAHGSGESGFADAAAACRAAEKVGFPLMIKASAGGGGKGMRRVLEPEHVAANFEAARREALASFSNGAVYLERLIENPRHVEIQVMRDSAGQAVHYFERDCSVQRRHQKVIEETPCPVLSDRVRHEMGEIAVRAAHAVEYVGAGTVEFLYDAQSECFFFLEMNTRLQVEHPITELCCGVDLVREQLRIAAGEPLSRVQETIRARGAAIECRIYAEDPVDFLPSPGHVSMLRSPSGPGVRDDGSIVSGADVSMHYDPLISKLCVWASTRDQAIARMARALDEYRVVGIETNLPFHRAVMKHESFRSGIYDTGFIADHRESLRQASFTSTEESDNRAIAAVLLDMIDSAEPALSGPEPSAWRRSRSGLL